MDDVLESALHKRLLDRMPELPAAQRQIRRYVKVPMSLQDRIKEAIECCVLGDDPSKIKWTPLAHCCAGVETLMPAKVTVGDSRAMHQDTCFNDEGNFEETIAVGYLAILYLYGSGTFFYEGLAGKGTINLQPGRLVVWLNESCMHRVESSVAGEVRKMLGPMLISSDGLIQPVGHQGTWFSEYPEYRKPRVLDPPKPDLFVTVLEDDGTWRCTLLSGEEIARIPFGVSNKGIQRVVLNSIANNDVNVRLIDTLGNPFEVFSSSAGCAHSNTEWADAEGQLLGASRNYLASVKELPRDLQPVEADQPHGSHNDSASTREPLQVSQPNEASQRLQPQINRVLPGAAVVESKSVDCTWYSCAPIITPCPTTRVQL